MRTQKQPAKRSRLGVGSAAENVYRSLRREIVEGAIRGGERLREQDLSERFGVSRTPIREALKKLEVDGLVTVQFGRGLVVVEPTSEDIMEIYAIREVMEGLAARLAAQRRADTDCLRLGALLDAIESRPPSRPEVVRLNADFHAAVWRAGGNKRLLRIMVDLQEAVRRFEHSTLEFPGRATSALDEHRRLVAAIEAQDAEAASEIAMTHMRHARDVRVLMSVQDGAEPVDP